MSERKPIFCDICGKDITKRKKPYVYENPNYPIKYFCSREHKEEYIFNLSRLNEEDGEVQPEIDVELLHNQELEKRYQEKKEKINDIKQASEEMYNKHGPRNKRWEDGNNPNMFLITVHLLNKDLESIEELIRIGLYPNRSEAIRSYVSDGILRDLQKIEQLKKLSDFQTGEYIYIANDNRQQQVKQLEMFQKFLFPETPGEKIVQIKIFENGKKLEFKGDSSCQS
ncbi:MAG: hypothetical protein ACFFKA_18595 [Candidatus Thorarchaeota archaeon]